MKDRRKIVIAAMLFAGLFAVLAIALALAGGCAMPGSGSPGAPPVGFANTLDAWAAGVGLSPEALAAASETTVKAAPFIPSPVGDIAKVLAGVLGAGAIGWAGYRKRKQEAATANLEKTGMASALKSVTDFIDALPVCERNALIPGLKAQQEKDGTRETVRAIRG